MRRLLVVDAEESICFSVKQYFTLHDYSVDTARNLDEAEKLFETQPYDVVIHDLALGRARNLDGLELIKLIRNRRSHTRIVVLTAHSSSTVEQQALTCGADAFLRKPKPLSNVAQVIQNLIDDEAYSHLSERQDHGRKASAD